MMLAILKEVAGITGFYTLLAVVMLALMPG
jgi:hypothetical protein